MQRPTTLRFLYVPLTTIMLTSCTSDKAVDKAPQPPLTKKGNKAEQTVKKTAPKKISLPSHTAWNSSKNAHLILSYATDQQTAFDRYITKLNGSNKQLQFNLENNKTTAITLPPGTYNLNDVLNNSVNPANSIISKYAVTLKPGEKKLLWVSADTKEINAKLIRHQKKLNAEESTKLYSNLANKRTIRPQSFFIKPVKKKEPVVAEQEPKQIPANKLAELAKELQQNDKELQTFLDFREKHIADTKKLDTVHAQEEKKLELLTKSNQATIEEILKTEQKRELVEDKSTANWEQLKFLNAMKVNQVTSRKEQTKDLALLKKELVEKQKQSEKSTSTVDELESTLKELSTEHSNKVKLQLSLTDRDNQIKSSISRLKDKRLELARKNDQLGLEATEAVNSKKLAMNLMQNIMKQDNVSEENLTKLNEKVKEIYATIKATDKEKNKILTAIKSVDKNLSQQQTERDKVLEQLSTLQSELTKQESLRLQKNTKLQSSTASLLKSNQEIEILKNKINLMKETTSTTPLSLQAIDKRVSDLHTKQDILNKERQETVDTLKRLATKKEQLKSAILKQKKTVNDNKKTAEKREKEEQVITAKIEARKSQVGLIRKQLSLTSQNKKLIADLHAINTNASQNKEKLERLQETFSKARTELTTTSNKLKTSFETIEVLKQDIKEQQDKYNNKENEISKLQLEIQRLKTTITEKSKAENVTEDVINALKETITTKDTEQTAKQAEINGLKQRIALLKKEVDTREQSLNAKAGIEKAVLAEKGLLEQKIDSLKIERETALKEKQTAETKRASTVEEHMKLKNEKNELEKQALLLTDKLKTAHDKNKQINQRISTLVQQRDNLNNIIGDLQQKLADQIAKYDASQKKIAEITAQKDAETKKLKDELATIEAKNAKLAKADSIIKQLQQDIKQLVDKTRFANDKLTMEKQKHTEATRTIENLQANKRELAEKIDDLEKRLRNSENKTDKIQKTEDNKRLQLENRITEKETEISRLGKLISGLEDDKKDNNSQISNLKKEIKRKNIVLSKLRKEVEDRKKAEKRPQYRSLPSL